MHPEHQAARPPQCIMSLPSCRFRSSRKGLLQSCLRRHW